MHDKTLYQKLLDTIEKHGRLIVGVDFDDTIFALNPIYDNRAANLRKLLKDLVDKDAITICLYTVADKQSILYKVALMESWGISPEFVNESPVKLGDGGKPFFNLLIDDKAGFTEVYNYLHKLNQEI